MSDTTTRGCASKVESEYLPDQSNRETYTFAYHVRFQCRRGDGAARQRELIITDGDGNVERGEGPGVVGEFPQLDPGEASSTPASVRCDVDGTMHGSYTMRTRDGGGSRAISPFTWRPG